MKLWVIPTKDYKGFDQLYNINSCGTVEEFSIENIKAFNTHENYCFIVENEIVLDEITTLPRVITVDGFLSRNPIHSTITNLNTLLEKKIPVYVVTDLILNSPIEISFIKFQERSVLTNSIENLIRESKLSPKEKNILIKLVQEFTRGGITVEYCDYVMSYLVEQGYLDKKLVSLYKRVYEVLCVIAEIKNESNKS